MTEYIPKSALVAEIDRMLETIEQDIKDKNLTEQNVKDRDLCTIYAAQLLVLRNLAKYLDTLEVKEVDFEEELKCYCNDYYNCDYPKQLEEGNCSEVMPHIVSAAKHFFKLGLKAQKGGEV